MCTDDLAIPSHLTTPSLVRARRSFGWGNHRSGRWTSNSQRFVLRIPGAPLPLTIPLPKASARHKAWHPRSRGQRSDPTWRVERGSVALDEYFQCVFLRGAQKARASTHVKTGRALDPALFKVVQQQRGGDFLTAPSTVQQRQGICAPSRVGNSTYLPRMTRPPIP